ncbi:MAG: DUF1015 domain-containing protein [Bacillota bacterium]
MASIKPFKGIRYNQSKIQNTGEVITPPYDVIDDAEQERLHKLNPYNVIRLEYGRKLPADNEKDNRYIRAGETFKQWLNNNILVQEQESCYYLYEQSYIYNQVNYRRRGIIAALRLTPYSERAVLPHELTMSGPKADRLELLKNLRTNVSPIFTLFPDPELQMDRFFSSINQEMPLLEASEPSGQTHRLWSITDRDLQRQITYYLEPQPLLIADGHHRYETALHYAGEQNNCDTPGADYILTIMVSMKDSGLLVLPTHRLLSGLTQSQKDKLNRIINKEFKLTSLGDPRQLARKNLLKEIKSASLNFNGFGLITGRDAYILYPPGSRSGKKLPVELLHEYILKPLFDAYDKSFADQEKISYPHDLDTAVDDVVTGYADTAFILEPVAVEQILEHARRGKVMPQKSTFFYPKLPGGLVLYNLDLS